MRAEAYLLADPIREAPAGGNPRHLLAMIGFGT